VIEKAHNKNGKIRRIFTFLQLKDEKLRIFMAQKPFVNSFFLCFFALR